MQSVRFNHRFASPVHIPTSSNAPYICACSSSVHLSGRSFSFVQTILLWRQTSHVPLPQIHDAHKVRPPSCMLRQTIPVSPKRSYLQEYATKTRRHLFCHMFFVPTDIPALLHQNLLRAKLKRIFVSILSRSDYRITEYHRIRSA